MECFWGHHTAVPYLLTTYVRPRQPITRVICVDSVVDNLSSAGSDVGKLLACMWQRLAQFHRHPPLPGRRWAGSRSLAGDEPVEAVVKFLMLRFPLIRAATQPPFWGLPGHVSSGTMCSNQRGAGMSGGAAVPMGGHGAP